MNTKKVTPVIELLIRTLIPFGISKEIIAKATNINPVTLSKHIAFPVIPTRKRYQMILNFYISSLVQKRAHATVQIYDAVFQNNTEHIAELLQLCENLVLPLEQYLEINHLQIYYSGIVDGKTIATKSEFSREVPESYRTLFKAIYSEEFFYHSYFTEDVTIQDLLFEMKTKGQLPNMINKDYLEEMKTLIREWCRNYDSNIGLLFNQEMMIALKKDLDAFNNRDKTIIVSYFGIDQELVPADEIAKQLNVTISLIHQKKAHIIKLLRRSPSAVHITREKIVTNHFTAQNDRSNSQEKIQQLEIRTKSLSSALEQVTTAGLSTEEIQAMRVSLVLSDRYQQNLIKPIEDIDFSVRTYNCLKAHKLHCLGDIIQFSEEELLKNINFGKKTIEEIVEILAEYDLHLKQLEKK